MACPPPVTSRPTTVAHTRGAPSRSPHCPTSPQATVCKHEPPASAETEAEPETGFNVAPFPDIGDSASPVVGGGDVMVMFKDNPAARALIQYLGTPEAAEIWAERGGFSSPNQNVDPEVYPDDIQRTTATALAEAEVFRFDLSDLQPAAFGSDAMFTILQDFLRTPDDVDGTAQKLEDAAAQAFG